MDAYEVLGPVGSGSFGTVAKIKRKVDGRILVWKEMNYGSMSEKEKQLLVSEVNILREFRHPHIVRYYDRIIDREHRKIFIVMEHCEGGDLASLVKKAKKEKTPIDEELIWKFFLQICLALKECHSRKEGRVLHRDLKPGNVLLDANMDVKLGDFGLARVLSEHSRFATTNVGTPFYMSPEQVNEQAYNERSDIWSLGCMIYELCALSPPFEATNQIALGMKIRAGVFKPIPSIYSEELSRLVTWMLQLETSKRPSIDEILSAPPMTIRLQQRKLSQQHSLLKQREEALARKVAELKRREAELEERERAVEARERELTKKEKSYEEISSPLASGAAAAARPGTSDGKFFVGRPPKRPSGEGLEPTPTTSGANTPLSTTPPPVSGTMWAAPSYAAAGKENAPGIVNVLDMPTRGGSGKAALGDMLVGFHPRAPSHERRRDSLTRPSSQPSFEDMAALKI